MSVTFIFKNCRKRKNHNLLFRRNQQVVSRLNQPHPVNILRIGPIIYYSINFYQHKNFHDFNDESILDSFFHSVQQVFTPTGSEMKIEGYFELKNYQQTEIVKIENTRVWLTSLYGGKYFNRSVRGQIKEDILKTVIINCSMSSTWLFKWFNKLHIIVTDKKSFSNSF